MICDSTNVFSIGRSGSEMDVRKNLLKIFERLKKRIIVTCFASNVARMETIFFCAQKTGRQISHIWPDLKCNIYATPFTAVLVTEKFKEKKIDIQPFLKIVNLRGNIKLGPFDIELITMTHSILEPNGLKIKTPLGSVLHTGDWKCDPNPLIGDEIDSKKLKSIGDEGVLAMICDSTNVFSIGRSGLIYRY